MKYIPINLETLEKINGMKVAEFLEEYTQDDLEALQWEYRLITVFNERLSLSMHGAGFVNFEKKRLAAANNTEYTESYE